MVRYLAGSTAQGYHRNQIFLEAIMDIIDKIRQAAPSDIDRAAIDIERRKSLTDRNIQKMLTKVFNGIDVERLNPSLSWRYNRIKERIW